MQPIGEHITSTLNDSRYNRVSTVIGHIEVVTSLSFWQGAYCPRWNVTVTNATNHKKSMSLWWCSTERPEAEAILQALENQDGGLSYEQHIDFLAIK